MHPKQFSLTAGIIMLAVGLTAFIPSLSWDPNGYLPPLDFEASYGLYLGLFPMNIINKLALCLFGAAGIGAYYATNSLPASVRVARAMAIVMIPGAFLGLLPQTNTFFGYWPLFGAEVALHAIFGLLGAYFGWALSLKAHRRIGPLLQH